MADMEAASLVVKIGTEGDDAAGKKIQTLGDKIDSAGKSATKTGTMMTLGLTTPILAFGAASIMSASNTAEAQAKVDTVFGTSSDVMNAWAASSSQAWGLSEQDALAAGGTLGNIFTSMGFGQEQAAGLSTSMLELAIDTASFNNASTDEAVLAMTSALTGEYEALKKYGIVLNETTLDQTAMNMGLGESFSALTEQEKVLVRQQAIMDQSANATGDFARTQDGLANQMKIAKAEFENITATIGELFLPMATKAMTGFSKFLLKFSEVSPLALKIVAGIAIVLAVIGPLLVGFGMLVTAGSAIVGVFTGIGGAIAGAGGIFAVLTGPIALIIAALVGLGIAYKTNFMGFGDAVRNVGSKIKAGFDKIKDAVGQFMGGFKKAWDSFGPGPSKVMSTINKLGGVADKTGKSVNNLSRFFHSLAGGLRAIGGDNTPAFFVMLANAMDSVGNFISELIARFQIFRDMGLNPVSAALSALGAMITPLAGTFSNLSEMVTHVVDAFKALLDGDVLGFFESMGEAINSAGRAIAAFARESGEMLADAFRAIDWAALWEGLQKAADAALDWLQDAADTAIAGLLVLFNTIDWGAAWEGLKTAASAAWDVLSSAAGTAISAVIDAISNVDWGGFLSGAWSAIKMGLEFAWAQISNIDWDAVIGKAVEVGQKVLDWIKETLGSIDWLSIIGTAVEIGTKIYDWVKETLTAIDWTMIVGAAFEIGKNIFEWFKMIIGAVNWSDLVGKVKEIGQAAFDWLMEELGSTDWKAMLGEDYEVGKKVFNWFKMIIGAINWGEIVGTVYEIGKNVFSWLKMIIGNINWGEIVGTVYEIGKGVFEWLKMIIGNISWTELFGAGIDLGAKFIEWLTGLIEIPEFPGWPSKDEILYAITGGRFGDNGEENSSETNAEPKKDGGGATQGAQFGGGGITFDSKGVQDFTAMLQPLVDAANTARAAVGTFNMETLKTPPILAQSQTAAPVYGGAFATAATQVQGSGTSIISTLGGIAQNTLLHMSGARASASSHIGQMVTDVINKASNMRAQTGSNIGTMASDVAAKTSNMRSQATSQFQTMAGNASTQSRSTMSNMISGIAGGLGGVASNFISMKTTANSRMGEMASSATTQGNSTMANMVGALAGGMVRVAWTLMGISTAVSNAGSAAAGQASSAGANIGNSFASAMEASLGRIRAAASAMGDAAAAAIRAKLSIQSPSKVFTKIGAFVGEGLDIGIRSMIPRVAKTTAALVAIPAMADSALGLSTPGIPAGGSLAVGVGNGGTVINQIFTLHGEQLAALIDKAERGSTHASAWQDPEAIIQFLKGL